MATVPRGETRVTLTRRAAVQFCAECGAAYTLGEDCPECSQRGTAPPTGSPHPTAVRHLAYISCGLGLLWLGASLGTYGQFLAATRSATLAAVLSMLPALLALGFGVVGLRHGRREPAIVWPYAAVGLVTSGLALLVLLLVALR